jgi:hypothetical protein
MKLHVLAIILDGGAVETSLHETRAEAERAAAEQIMEKMLTESALDLSGILTAMDRAFVKGEYPDVIRFFERIKRRKAIFIQECQVNKSLATV